MDCTAQRLTDVSALFPILITDPIFHAHRRGHQIPPDRLHSGLVCRSQCSIGLPNLALNSWQRIWHDVQSALLRTTTGTQEVSTAAGLRVSAVVKPGT